LGLFIGEEDQKIRAGVTIFIVVILGEDNIGQNKPSQELIHESSR